MKKYCLVHNLSRSISTPVVAQYCSSFACRLRGLTFRRVLAAERGLLLVQPRQNRLDAGIHMLTVFMDLAVVWIDEDLRVVDTRLARAWRAAYLPSAAAKYVLEMNPARRDDYQVGDVVRFEEVFVD